MKKELQKKLKEELEKELIVLLKDKLIDDYVLTKVELNNIVNELTIEELRKKVFTLLKQNRLLKKVNDDLMIAYYVKIYDDLEKFSREYEEKIDKITNEKDNEIKKLKDEIKVLKKNNNKTRKNI